MAGTVATRPPLRGGVGGELCAHAAARSGHLMAADEPRRVAVIPRESGYQDGQFWGGLLAPG